QALGKAHLPYYYLKTDIWDIHWKNSSVTKIPGSDSGARKLIDHVTLKPGLFEVLRKKTSRELVKERLFFKVEEDVRTRDIVRNETFQPPENIDRYLERNFGKVIAEKWTPAAEPKEGPISLEFAKEEWLKELLVNRWSEIDEFRRRNLVIYGGRETGVEYDTRTAGRIDILAENANNGEFTVIELKRGISRAEHLGQLLRYMGWVRGRISEGKEVNGLLIAAGFKESVQYAIAELEKVNLLEYNLQFQLKPF
ncbi:MAG: endonuclease NucS domain-containing protein, partial [Candidatus Hodarchaeales archaeon]